MSPVQAPLTDAVREAARRSVLCWLATVDAEGQPNVSPKEVWTIADDQHVVVAHIASPISARNIAQQPQVCLSFVDVFVQKGFKLVGTAREVRAADAEFATWARTAAGHGGPALHHPKRVGGSCEIRVGHRGTQLPLLPR
jgi:predicted pyridoxine 5'-phosphate oxidase superfamily flavin-nucleotide-binding protein